MCKRDICGSRPRWKLKHRSRVDAVQRQACFPPLPLSTSFSSLRERLERGLVPHRLFLSEIKDPKAHAPTNSKCWSSGLGAAAGVSNFARERPFHRCRPGPVVCGFPPYRCKQHSPKRAPDAKLLAKPELSSGLMSSSCVMTEAVRLLLNRSHHLTCCMGKTCTETPPRETLASFDCRSRLDDRDSSDFESFRLHELGPLVLHDVLESARMIYGSQQQLLACCLQLGVLFLRCRGPVLMPHGTQQAHWQTYFRTPGFPTSKDDVPSVRPWRVSLTGQWRRKSEDA